MSFKQIAVISKHLELLFSSHILGSFLDLAPVWMLVLLACSIEAKLTSRLGLMLTFVR